jgi:DNA-nicking Smr family endonuclease
VTKKRHPPGTALQPAPKEPKKATFADREALTREYSTVRPLEKKGGRAYGQELPTAIAAVPVRFRRFWSEDRRVTAMREGVSEQEVRSLRNGRCDPRSVLDLHGARVSEVAGQVHEFIRERYARGARVLLLVHGKGVHSEGGVGVLGDQVVKTLTEGPSSRYVRALTTASDNLGGRGALVVQLIP